MQIHIQKRKEANEPKNSPDFGWSWTVIRHAEICS